MVDDLKSQIQLITKDVPLMKFSLNGKDNCLQKNKLQRILILVVIERTVESIIYSQHNMSYAYHRDEKNSTEEYYQRKISSKT